ncbi:hypothetical protein TDB9533_03665 [Thalassocella blandensis]|nr:hypothetical protein TDB9533_03665 [Thalassocella blandensis]
MQLLLSELKHFTLAATDNNDIGEPKDFLLDDKQWAVRYVVLKAHPWIPLTKKVLLSPVSLKLPNVGEHTIQAELTHDAIKNGPLLDDHLPVSRANEIELFHHYGYAYYWMGPGLWGTYPHPGALVDQNALDLQKQAGPHREGEHNESHLRSFKELRNYAVKVGDFTIGEVLDFVMDDTSWRVEYVVVAGEETSSKHFRLIPMNQINRVAWEDRAIYIDMSRDEFSRLREYDNQKEISSEILAV